MKTEITINSIELVKKLKKIFPKNDYYLISLQEKTYIWEKDVDISKNNPIKEEDTGIIFYEDLSYEQKKLYKNLYGNKLKPENVVRFNLEPKLIVNTDKNSSKILILGEKKLNLKNQQILKFIFLNFREYTIDELKEKETSEQDFINSLVDSFYPNFLEKDLPTSNIKNSSYIKIGITILLIFFLILVIIKYKIIF